MCTSVQVQILLQINSSISSIYHISQSAGRILGEQEELQVLINEEKDVRFGTLPWTSKTLNWETPDLSNFSELSGYVGARHILASLSLGLVTWGLSMRISI